MATIKRPGLLYFSTITSTCLGLTCLNCPDITHPRFCDHVKHCSQGEVCGLERTLDEYGDVRFKLGCFQPNVCVSRNLESLNFTTTPSGQNTCFRCCISSDMCNTHGCGETDSLQSKSTTCYRCEGNLYADHCNRITVCVGSKMCYIEDKERLGENYYSSGCIETHVCKSSYNPFGRRDIMKTTRPLRCCHGNLCNSPGGSTYIAQPTISSGHHSTQYPWPSQSTIDYRGQMFLLIFPGTHYPGDAYPQVLVAVKERKIVTSYSFSSHFNTTMTLSPEKLSFNKSIIMSDGKLMRGIELTTNLRTSVYVFVYNNHTADKESYGYLAFPTKVLSTTYIIPTYKPVGGYYHSAFIAITATKPNTIINIYMKKNGKSSIYKNIALNKYETFQLSETVDFSGTFIKATNPIAVWSGHENNYISVSAANPFVQMILPLHQWDKVYVIPTIATRPSSTVRLYSNNLTNVQIHQGDKSEIKQIAARGVVDLVHNTISFINASHDIMVMIFPYGLSDTSGDGFMMTIHGVNQYLSQYDFAVPNGITSFISIVVSTGYINGFVLDDKHINHITSTHIFGGPFHFSTFTVDITSGTHQIRHTAGVRFGLWVYGNGLHDSYGYPAGIGFRTED